MTALSVIARRRSGGGAPPAFDPTTVAGLTYWGKNVVTQSGGTASAWLDQSGLAHDFNQATVGNQPAVEAAAGAGINALQDLKFNGTTSKMAGSATSSLISTTAYTVIYVVQPTAIVNSYTGTSAFTGDGCLGDNGGYWQLGFATNSGGQAYVWQFDSANRLVTVPVAAGSSYLLTVQLSAGTLSLQSASHTAATLAGCGAIGSLSSTAVVGQNYNATTFGSFRIAEAMVWNVAISGANIASAQAALIYKYNITT